MSSGSLHIDSKSNTWLSSPNFEENLEANSIEEAARVLLTFEPNTLEPCRPGWNDLVASLIRAGVLFPRYFRSLSVSVLKSLRPIPCSQKSEPRISFSRGTRNPTSLSQMNNYERMNLYGHALIKLHINLHPEYQAIFLFLIIN